jgi:hypothetical protein
MGRRKKSEIGKVKIKLVAGKINEISLFDKEGNNLENELNEEGDRGFSEFIETGGARAPVLENGQGTSSRGVPVLERQPGEQTGPKEARSAAGLVNPEFSVYEIARGFARGGGDRRGKIYQTVNQAGDPVMQSRIQKTNLAEMNTVTSNNRRVFENPELERLRAGDERREYYESKIDVQEEKAKRRGPWNG